MDILELQKLIKAELGSALAPTLAEIKAALPEQIAAVFAKEVTPDRIKSIVALAPEQRQGDPLALSKQVVDMYHLSLGQKAPHGTDFDLLKERKNQLALTGVSVGAANSAGNLVPQELSSDWINLIHRDDQLLSACRRHPMSTDSLLIPTLAGGVTVSWTPETTNTSSMASQATGLKPETQITTGQVTLTRYCAHARVLVSRKSLRIANPMVEDILRTDVPAAIRAAIAKAILQGTATAASDPVAGLDSLITTNTKSWNDAKPLRGIIDLLFAPGISKGPLAASTLAVMGPQAASILMSEVVDGNGRPLLSPGPSGSLGELMMYGVKSIIDYNIPATYGGGTDSRITVGNFGNHAHIGIEDAMFVQVNPYRYSENNLVELLYEIYAGFVPSHESCFANMNVPTA